MSIFFRVALQSTAILRGDTFVARSAGQVRLAQAGNRMYSRSKELLLELGEESSNKRGSMTSLELESIAEGDVASLACAALPFSRGRGPAPLQGGWKPLSTHNVCTCEIEPMRLTCCRPRVLCEHTDRKFGGHHFAGDSDPTTGADVRRYRVL